MLGEIQTGKVIDENQDAYYVQIKGISFELKRHELTQEQVPSLGSTITGFIYENQQGKKEMTQFLPFAQLDQYGWGRVTSVRPNLGVFVDIGLPDKDVVVSLDDLPADRSRWPKEGDRLLVKTITDEKERIWAKLADENIFEQLRVQFPDNMANKNVFVTVYASREIGAFALTNDYYLAFIHVSQMMRPLRLGEQIKARVIGISKYGRLNLSILPRAFEEIDDDAAMILMSLRRKADKKLPFSDKSAAADIKEYFGISKSAFKRALGHLLKNGYIKEDKSKDEIILVDDPEKDE